MNIAYILHSSESTNGAAKAFVHMLNSLMPMGIRPYVVLPDQNGLYEELSSRDIPTLSVTYRPSTYPYYRTLKECLLFIPRLTARIIVNHRATKVLKLYFKENKIDIVHSNSGIVRIGFDAAQAAGVPHIYHIREYADMIGYHYYPTKGAFINQLDCNLSYSICITHGIQNHYRQDTKEQVSRVIYDGVFSEKETMPTAQVKNYFLFAGRIQPAKGLDQLLKAYNLYTEKTSSPLPLKVAGGYSDITYYQKQLAYIKKKNLTEVVEFLGNRSDITRLMRDARALIVSSSFEGFGFCMPEAMQQGCLVIGRNTSGTKEQLDKALQMTGQEIALRYESVEKLAQLLTEVASQPLHYYDSYRERAFKVVNNLYTIEANAYQVSQFYQYIATCHQERENQ